MVSYILMTQLFRCIHQTTNSFGWPYLWVLILSCLLSATASAVEKQVEAIVAEPDRVTVLTNVKVTYKQGRLAADAAAGLSDRCYVDMSPVTLGSEVPRYLALDSPLLLRVRVAQFRPRTVRVVLDLVEGRTCEVTEALGSPGLQVVVLGNEHIGSGVSDKRASVGRGMDLVLGSALPSQDFGATPQDDSAVGSAEVFEATVLKTGESGLPEDSSRVLTLDEAYQLAIQNEEQIEIAARELAKAELLPWRALALMAPRGEIAASYSRNKDSIAFNAPREMRSVFGGTSVIRPQDNWHGSLEVTQPLLKPSFFPAWRLGKQAVEERKQRYDFRVRRILLGVAKAYYELLRYVAQAKVARDTLVLSREESNRAQIRFRVGEVTKTDVLRAEVAVGRAERSVVVEDNRLKMSRTVLARVVGLAEGVSVTEPPRTETMELDYAKLLDFAYANRQDLRAESLNIAIARENKNMVLARYLPEVHARFSYPRLDPETFANRDEFWSFFVNLRWSIFDGGMREIDLLEANENISQAELGVDELKKNIRVEVKGALLTVQTLETTLETVRNEVSLANENYVMTSKQYRVGLSTSLDVNTALNALNQVRTQLIDQTYAYQIAILNLDDTTGSFAENYISQR